MGRRAPRWANTRLATRQPDPVRSRVRWWETALIWVVPTIVLIVGIGVAQANDFRLCGRAGDCDGKGLLASLLLVGLVVGAAIGVIYLLGWRGGARRQGRGDGSPADR